MITWRCFAQPAPDGETCGHLNRKALLHPHSRHLLFVCEKCGCTKIASDDRERLAKEEA